MKHDNYKLGVPATSIFRKYTISQITPLRSKLCMKAVARDMGSRNCIPCLRPSESRGTVLYLEPRRLELRYHIPYLSRYVWLEIQQTLYISNIRKIGYSLASLRAVSIKVINTCFKNINYLYIIPI